MFYGVARWVSANGFPAYTSANLFFISLNFMVHHHLKTYAESIGDPHHQQF